jgi:hypothetical protein
MAMHARESIASTLKFKVHFMAFNRATLADGMFPGPVITAQKVSFRVLHVVHQH